MTLLQCLVCGDLVSPSEDPRSSIHCRCGRAFAVMNHGVLEVGGTGRAVWLDHAGAVTDRPPSDADGAPATRRRFVPALL
jgi:hypothetical protein